ncbi:MAG: hypothetical protein GXO10_04945 [Crenarchaeota archaeon]|nr:hypothetical protein [Thermoproteota archaeon]
MVNEILPTKEQILEESIPEDLCTYCEEVADDEDVWRKLASLTGEEAVKAQVLYCINVRDREAMWKALLNTPPNDVTIVEHLALYLVAVHDRPEIRKHIVTSKCLEMCI